MQGGILVLFDTRAESLMSQGVPVIISIACSPFGHLLKIASLIKASAYAWRIDRIKLSRKIKAVFSIKADSFFGMCLALYHLQNN